jgi:hypothetical protein
VHFTGPGYHLLGDAVVRDLLSQYDLFLKARGGSVVAAHVAAPANQAISPAAQVTPPAEP